MSRRHPWREATPGKFPEPNVEEASITPEQVLAEFRRFPEPADLEQISHVKRLKLELARQKRNAYQREYQRKRRQKEREEKNAQDG